MKTLEKIKNSCEKFPERNAFFINDKFYTYKEFSYLVSNIKDLIEKEETKKGNLIGIIINDDIYTYSSIFAILFSGNAYVPINPDNPIDRNINIIEQAGIKIILTSERIPELENHKKLKTLKISDTSKIENKIQPLVISDISDNESAYLLFTSGSTGIPKGVPITRKALDSFVDSFFLLDYKINQNDGFLQMFDLTFDLSIMSYVIPLCIGACVYPVPSNVIKYTGVYDIMETHEITFALMVPSILSFLRPYFNDIKLEKLRYSLFCGEALYDDIAGEWSECVPNALIQNVYGPTEATIFCLTYNWNKKYSEKKSFNGIVSIGKPMNNVSAIIVDENLKILPDGEKGELCLSGNQLTEGYWKDIEKNKESFFKLNNKEKLFYRTGDICFIDEGGDFAYCGRLDNQIKVQGFRVELSEIEHHVRQITGLANVAAIPLVNKFGNTEIYLFVENYQDDANKIHEYLKLKIPQYMLPVDISSIPVFPLTSNGKINRKALLELIKLS
ncbi:MAG: AMP-binding protein [Bacteroidales bacterium]|nr:AMP-binding protein [Bacteroidales bacterium]